MPVFFVISVNSLVGSIRIVVCINLIGLRILTYQQKREDVIIVRSENIQVCKAPDYFRSTECPRRENIFCQRKLTRSAYSLAITNLRDFFELSVSSKLFALLLS
jgi:hypothetical protein